MVQPVRLVVGISTLLSLTALGARAAADPIPSTCRTGLVLGVSDQDAEDITASICAAAKKRNVPGLLRVSIVRAGDRDRLRIAIARQVDTSREERTTNVIVDDVSSAVSTAPSVVDSLVGPPPQPQRPQPPQAAPPPSPPPSVAAPRIEEPQPEEKDLAPSPAAPKPSALTTMIGVHGTSAFAGGEAGFGGGGSLGIDSRGAQGFVEYGVTRGDLDYAAFGLGARLKIGKSALQPVIGGGWSFVDWETTKRDERHKGKGIGAFGEGGILYSIANHQLMALARLNFGLYREEATRLATNADGVQYRTTIYSGSSSSITSTFSLLAGYAYVFR